jgi:hypothetical protein
VHSDLEATHARIAPAKSYHNEKPYLAKIQASAAPAVTAATVKPAK